MTHILHASTVHKTALLADEGNSAYSQSSGAHNNKHNQSLGTDNKTFCSRGFGVERDTYPQNLRTKLNFVF